MPEVTFILRDGGFDYIQDRLPIVEFFLSGPTMKGDVFLATTPVVAEGDVSGNYTVNLASTVDMVPERYFVMRVTVQNGVGVPLVKDNPGWKIRVPITGGDLWEMIDAPVPSYLIWWDPEPPVNPGLWSGWADTSEPVPAEGMPYYEWEA